jgi:hypothetical protein
MGSIQTQKSKMLAATDNRNKGWVILIIVI